MHKTTIAVVQHGRPLRSFAAAGGSYQRGYDISADESGDFQSQRARVCYESFTIENLAVRGSSATTARVKTTTSLRRPATKDTADTHDGALFRRLEEFFAARRAEVRANKLSAPA